MRRCAWQRAMSSGKRALLSATLLIMICVPAWAVNKCTGPDGKLTYQDAACGNTSKATEQLKTWDNSTTSRANSWRFENKKDDMTGKVACMAISSITFPKAGTATKFIPVHAVVLASADSEVIGIRTSDNTNLFHNDISSMGMKTDSGQFTPFSVKSGSHVVGLESSAEMIRAMEKSKNLLVRARFWPYDQLYDMEPIPSAGFTAALRQARECAKR